MISFRAAFLTALLVVTGGGAIGHAHGPFDGAWSVDPDWCENVSGTDRVPVMIDLPEMRYHESICTVDTFERIGEGDAWRASMSCEGEGMTWEREAIFGLSPRLDETPPQLVHVDLEDGTILVYTRCP